MTATLGPVLCRLPRGYTLFLPRQFWNGLSEVEQTLVLEHELAHYLRRDVWKSLLVRLLALPHWFNPCAWWAVCRFDQCAEWACDETAQQLEPEQRISYAKTLMRLVEQAGSAQPCRSALFGSSVLYRVKRLLSPQLPEDTKMKKLVLSGLVIALLAFSLIRPQLVAQTPDSNVIAGNVPAVKSENGKTEVVRLPESLSGAQAGKQPAVPRENLRYDGKSFEEWNEILVTELKPNRRVEALRAIGEFGTRGYRTEAAQAIISIVREYEFTSGSRNYPSDIDNLQIAALMAFQQIASKEVLGILRTELQSGDFGRQKFVFRVFTERPARGSVEEKIRNLAPQLAPEFIAIANNRKSDQRVNAIEILRVRMYKTREVIPTFQNLMNNKDLEVAYYACRALAEHAPETEGLAKRLIELARDHDWKALEQLPELGLHAKPVLPDLMALIEHPISERSALSRAFAAIGEDAVQALIEDYKKGDKPRKQRILTKLRGMGPAAKSALPFLTSEYIAETAGTNLSMQPFFIRAFETIIRNEVDRERFFIKLDEMSKQLKRRKEENKKAQDRELNGVGAPINPLRDRG